MKPDIDVVLSEDHTSDGGEAIYKRCIWSDASLLWCKSFSAVAGRLLELLPEEAKAAGIALARQKLKISNTAL